MSGTNVIGQMEITTTEGKVDVLDAIKTANEAGKLTTMIFNELLALIETEFQRARRQASEATDSMEKHSRAGEAMAYADVKMLIAELNQKHHSDCSLHNAPAYPIARCDCDWHN